MIFISMPYYRTPETVERAIQSVINQTYQDWHLSIIVDGCEPPEIPDDPRVRVFELPENHGCFYANALNLAVCEADWFTVHDSDDWSEPDRYETLIGMTRGYDAVIDGIVKHRLNGQQRTGQSSHTGLFKPEKLRFCGPNPDYMTAWDTAEWKLFKHAFKARFPQVYKYHAVKRAESLTMCEEYGDKSEHRRLAREARNRLMQECYRTHYTKWPEILKPSPEIQASLDADIQRYRCSQ